MGKRTVLALLLAMCDAAVFAQQNLPRIVVLPLENLAGEQHDRDVRTFTELLSAFINETLRLNVISRMTLEAAMAARNWRTEDWDDISKTAEMGRVLNATYIVRGSVSPLGENLLVSAQVLDIATAELLSYIHMQLEDVSEAYLKMNSLAQLLTYNLNIPIEPAPPVAVEVPPPPVVTEVPLPEPAPPLRERSSRNIDPAAYWLNTLGVSIGTAFTAPVFVATVQGSIAPWRGSFFDLGVDIGTGSGDADVGHFSLYPFARYALFVPFAKGGGWHIGAGAGFMYSTYTFPVEGKISGNNFLADVSTGFIFRNGITLSSTLRTNFTSASGKLAVGWSYRFKQKGE